MQNMRRVVRDMRLAFGVGLSRVGMKADGSVDGANKSSLG